MEQRERGSAVPLVALVVVVVGGAVLGLGRIGAAGTARAAARTAADAAALAGAADGRGAAEELARANGAELVAYEGIGADTRVTVRVGPAEAVGRARRVGGGGAADGAAGRPGGSPRAAGTGAAAGGLAPALRAALARAEQLLGEPVPVTSGYRSPEAQADLYARRADNPYPVAAPGTSMHERGLAVDVPSPSSPAWRRWPPRPGCATRTPTTPCTSRSAVERLAFLPNRRRRSYMAPGRRVRLVIRRIEPLTVLKVSALFWASVYVILLVAALMLWSAATATGLRENVESFVGDLIAADDFSFKPAQMLRASVVGGALLVVLGSFATVMMAVLYNLISDVVGGVAIVFEERTGRAAERRAARQSRQGGATLGKIGARIADATKAAAAKVGDSVGRADGATGPGGDPSPPPPGSRPQKASPGQR